MQEAFVTAEEFGQDLEHVEVLQRKFDEFLKELENQQYRINEVNQAAERLIDGGHPDAGQIRTKQEEVNEAWHRLSTLAATRKEALFGAHEVQRFNRDTDETLAWMDEKGTGLHSDDYGRDLTTCQALQRKHEGTERDLAALESKVAALGRECERLKQLHPDRADHIDTRQKETLGKWDELLAAARNRKTALERSFMLHRLYADYRDLMSWMHDMKNVIAADELAKDVAGAESLLERHQEHKGEIDAREDSFQATDDAGQRLLDENVSESADVRDKLRQLAQVRLYLTKSTQTQTYHTCRRRQRC